MKKTTFQKFAGLICLLVISLLSFSKVALAEETDENQIGYHIYAIPAPNQVGEKDSFFNLRMQPGQEQTIEFVIANTSDEDQSYQLSLNQAYTNTQGYIDYSEKKTLPAIDESYTIDKIAVLSDEITVPKQSTKQVPITLTMPEKEFDGEILAGIRVIKQGKKQKTESISNEYGYILGLRLTESDKELKREIQLKSVKPAVSFGKTSIAVELLNPIMESYGNLNYQAKIINKKNRDNSKEKNFTGLEMAPNSLYKFAFDWDGERLVAGKYQLELTITDKKDNKWVFNEAFTIEPQSAAKVNKVVVGNQGLPLSKILIGIILLILVVGIVGYYAWRKKKKIK